MRTFRRHLAIGDPQGPFETLLAVLEAHGALGDDGQLVPQVQLVSMGDHFDWGTPSQRPKATTDGLRTLAWLANHPPEQVVLLLGNHDLARVCELWGFDDQGYQAARAEADAAYRAGRVDAALEAQLRSRYPTIATAEVLARDCSTFSVEQQTTVAELLRSGRFQLAHEHGGLLLVHTGLTQGDFAAVGVPHTSAPQAAAGLNAFLARCVARWERAAFDLHPLYRPGSAKDGEARGVLAHRPADPAHADAAGFAGPVRRRYDPRELPDGFPQAIGHIRDGKCRELMPSWCDAGPGKDGPLRSLVVSGPDVRYQLGCAPGARLYFLDGGLGHASPQAYELFDLDTRGPAARLR